MRELLAPKPLCGVHHGHAKFRGDGTISRVRRAASLIFGRQWGDNGEESRRDGPVEVLENE
jgi:hypothetical protein